jgi:hypothetical protein
LIDWGLVAIEDVRYENMGGLSGGRLGGLDEEGIVGKN